MTEEVYENIESQQVEFHFAQADEFQRRDQQLRHERFLQQNSELREVHHKSLNETEELKKFQSSTFDTIARRISGNVFANPVASTSAPYPQELNPWSSSIEEPLHSSTVEKSERRAQNQDLRCQSGPSAKNSVIFSGRDSAKNYGADQQRLQISDLHFDKFTTPATLACWKIRFNIEVCTCSQFPTGAMQWIKEVELVDSVDELRSSSSTRRIQMPNFEVFDARIASALNRIIHNSHFRRRISLEEQKAQKQDRFLRGRQIAHLICEYFSVTGQIFCRGLCRPVHYWSSK